MASQVKAIAVDQSLVTTQMDLPQNLIDAFQYSLTFAQAAARAVNSDPSTQAYFDKMTSELQKIGWNLKNAEKVTLEQSAGRIKPADIVSKVVNPYLSTEEQQATASLLSAIEQPDAGVKDFVSFWSNKASTTASKKAMSMGGLSQRNNAPAVSMVYYGFDFAATAERWLFVEVDSAQLGINAYYLNMNLNMSLYNQIKDDLVKKILPKVQDHISSTVIDL